MGSIFNISQFRAYSPVYIETGSCLGQSIERALKAGFKIVKSVDISPQFYNHCLKRFKDRVELYLGKSTDVLHKMLEDVYQPAVIFLDAHPAGPGTGGHDELMKGNLEFHQDYILKNELAIILSHRPDHLIIIDDQRPGPEADAYMQVLKSTNLSYTFTFLDEQLPNYPIIEDKILVCTPY